MQIVVNDLMTHYQLQGKGKLVLFLHGWGDAATGSQRLQADLAKKYQVLAPDLPGFGKSQAPTSGWDLDDYSVWLRAFLDKLKISEPFAIVGHSNGGAIAIRAAATGQLEPQKIVLMAAAGIRSGKTMRRVGLKALAKVGNIATIGLPERYRKGLRQQLYRSAGSDLLTVDHMQDTFKKTIKQDVQIDASSIKQPTLLIFARNDKDVPVYMGQLYSELIPDSKLHVIEEAGHFVHLDKPDAVNNLIQDFLA